MHSRNRVEGEGAVSSICANSLIHESETVIWIDSCLTWKVKKGEQLVLFKSRDVHLIQQTCPIPDSSPLYTHCRRKRGADIIFTDFLKLFPPCTSTKKSTISKSRSGVEVCASREIIANCLRDWMKMSLFGINPMQRTQSGSHTITILKTSSELSLPC